MGVSGLEKPAEVAWVVLELLLIVGGLQPGIYYGIIEGDRF